MARLVYKARASSTAQGKSRVYFTCLPDDFDIYFEKVCGMILKHHNCAIWYDSLPNTVFDADTMENDISKMQLFVIPVTRKLLTTENRVKDTEISFANEHHIPILPLIMDRDIDDLFSEIFGDIQYLDPGCEDITAISFEEKLKRFLNGVLVNDDLAEKIRSAFDAYIFLSYRKKDRKYAQELMRLIHKNDFCRDIAIWYDEFLVPGESFNRAIAEALKKSDLFALVVTPNLVNEINYITTTEYPMAIETKKNILPVELDKTDRALLEGLYEDIPECVSASDSASLSQRLFSSIKDIALKEQTSSPEHLFFIGLAYFNGIDMEVDREKGLELIEAAANEDLPEAIEKMVSVYKLGDGKERNCRTAIEWQKKLVEANRAISNKNPSDDNLRELLYSLYHLGHGESELGLFDDALAHLGEISTLAPRIDDEGEANFLAHISLITSGRMFISLGKIPSAKKYMEKAIEFNKETVEKNPCERNKKNLLQSYHALAFTNIEDGMVNEAIEEEEKALEIALSLAKENGEENYATELFGIYHLLAYSMQSRGNYDEAEKYHKKSYEYKMMMDDEEASIASKEKKHVFTQNMGIIYLKKGLFKKAEEYFDEAYKLREEIYKEDGSLPSLIELGKSCTFIANTYLESEQYDLALRKYEKCVEIYASALNESYILEVAIHLAKVYGNMGYCVSFQGDNRGALEYYEKNLSILTSLAEKETDIGLQHAFTRACTNVSHLHLELGDVDTALKYLDTAGTRAQELVEVHGADDDYILLSEIYLAQFNIFKDMNDYERAEAAITKSIEILKSIYKNSLSLNVAESLLLESIKLGNLFERKGDYEKAFDTYEMGEEIYNEQYEKDRSVRVLDYYRNLILLRLTQASKALKKEDDIQKYAEKLIQHNGRVYSNSPSYEGAKELAFSYEHTALLYHDLRRYDKTQNLYTQAIELRQRLYEATKDNEDLYSLAKDYDHLGNAYRLDGDKETASLFFNKSKEYISILLEADQSEKCRDAYGVLLYHLAMVSYDGEITVAFLEKSYGVFDQLIKENAKKSYVYKATQVLGELASIYESDGNTVALDKCTKELERLKELK